jgi:hypothetical protein
MNDLSPEPVLLLILLRIDSLEITEILLNDAEKRRGGRISRPIERRLFMEVVVRCGRTFVNPVISESGLPHTPLPVPAIIPAVPPGSAIKGL